MSPFDNTITIQDIEFSGLGNGALHRPRNLIGFLDQATALFAKQRVASSRCLLSQLGN